MEVIQSIRNWAEAPFRQEMDIIHIFLLVGLVIVATVLWHRILSHLSEAVREI